MEKKIERIENKDEFEDHTNSIFSITYIQA